MAIDTTKNYKQVTIVQPARLPAGAVAGLNGVRFPAVQVPSSDANTLDDYEEGTFTPVVLIGATDITGTVAVARYTKVGRIVHIELDVQFNRGANTGNITMGGIPFTPAASAFLLPVMNGQAYAANAIGVKWTLSSGQLQWLGGVSTVWSDTQITTGTHQLWVSGSFAV